MYFAVITIFPDMFAALTQYGITGRAIANRQAHVDLINPRDFTSDNYRRIDDRPYGGGPGMVMMAEPLLQAIQHAKAQAAEYGCRLDRCRLDSNEASDDVPKDTPLNCPVVYLSPQGHTLNETLVSRYKNLDGMILLCGRYEGVDQRVIDKYVDLEISVGDYVLTGGELPAMVLMDSIIRRLPDVMGDALSAEQESFVDGLLDCPQYTKPIHLTRLDSDNGSDGAALDVVPDVLLSGHHANIAKWRFLQQVERTKRRRPDLWQRFEPSKEQMKWLQEQ